MIYKNITRIIIIKHNKSLQHNIEKHNSNHINKSRLNYITTLLDKFLLEMYSK